MTLDRLNRLFDQLTGQNLLLGIVWLGLVCVTIMLLLMMATRWGQSQPLKKCVFLSLLTHVLLATYATTIEIVGAAPPDGLVHTTLVEEEQAADDQSEQETQAPTKPWEVFSNDAPDPQQMTLDREEVAPQVKPLDETDEQPALPAPDLPSTPAMPAESRSLAQDTAPAPAEAAQEETIEAPAATRREADDLALVKRAGPTRAATPKNEGPPALAATSPGLPGKLTEMPALPRMVDLPATVTGPLVPSMASDQPARTETPLDADSLGGDGERPTNNELPRGAGIRSIVDREAGRVASMGLGTSPRAAPHANTLLAPRSGGGDEPGEAPRVYENRRAPRKAEIIASHGGSPDTEAAVKAALQWLAAHQHEDGRWDASRHGAGQERRVGTQHLGRVGVDADNGVTGLALLAFLGNGHTHLEGDYRETVARGLDFLLSTQRTNGSLSGDADAFAAMYCHGMAALAVSEAYAMTQDERLLAAVRKAIDYTLAAQHPTAGGWRYKPGENVCDTSQLGWQLMALKSAELAGIEMPPQARQGMLRFLQTVSSGRHGGLASYRPMNVSGERVSPSMTAEALVCRQFLGIARSHPACDEAGNYIAASLPGKGASNFYYWYYATLAMFQLQGDHWRRWNNALEATLIRSQRGEGDFAGSWDPDPLWGGHGGRVYSTALGALCLEVYYRFLPLYVQSSQAEKSAP